MAVFRYILLAVLLQVVIDKSECSVKFSSMPRAINVADKSPLKLQCSISLIDQDKLLKNEKVEDMEVQSISISKHTQSLGQHQAIAFIHSYNPNTAKYLSTADENGNLSPVASGRIRKLISSSQSGIKPELTLQTSSFLSIEFNSPKPQDSGDYSCVITLINKNSGLPRTLTKEIYIPDESIVGLAHEINSLQPTLEKKVEQLVAKYEANLVDRTKAVAQRFSKQLNALKAWKRKVVEYFSQRYKFVRSTQYNNRTYLASSFIALNIKSPKAMCEVLGGYLFEFEDSEEWNFVTDFLDTSFPGKYFYLGATYVLKNGEFRWMHSNKPLKFAPWGEGEPNNGTGNEYCLEIRSEDHTYWLNDVPCSSTRSSGQRDSIICEIPNETE